MAKWILLWLIVLISLYTDLQERKIYNKVVVPGIVAAIVLNGWEMGTTGLTNSLVGLLVGLAIFFLPFLMGGIAAGDVKLMGAIGAVHGPIFVTLTGLGTGVAGGLIALVILVRQKQLLASLKRIFWSIILFFKLRNKQSIQALDKVEYSATFPYGAAIAIGTLAASLITMTQGVWLR